MFPFDECCCRPNDIGILTCLVCQECISHHLLPMRAQPHDLLCMPSEFNLLSGLKLKYHTPCLNISVSHHGETGYHLQVPISWQLHRPTGCNQTNHCRYSTCRNSSQISYFNQCNSQTPSLQITKVEPIMVSTNMLTYISKHFLQIS